MKINEYVSLDIKEDRIDYYYRKKTREVEETLLFLKKYKTMLLGKSEKSEMLFSLRDVYYFESVDKKVFACLKTEILQISGNLCNLEELYSEFGFVRVNKSILLNIYKIDMLKSEFNMRVIAELDNGEKIQINRNYKLKFRTYLQKILGGVK